MHPRRTSPRCSLTAAAAALSLSAALLAPAGAHAAAGCSFDAAAGRVVVDASGPGTATRLSRASSGAIQVDSVSCGAATVANTDAIEVKGASGLQQIVVDLANGALAPGRTAEASGASEIEIAVDGGTGSELPLGDEVRVTGGAAADTVRFTAKDIGLNADGDADVTTTGVEVLAAEGNGGDDQLLGSGAVPASLPLRLHGGPGADTLAGGEADDVLEGEADDDTETGNGGRDTFRQGAAAEGADTLDGGGSPFDRIDYSRRGSGVRIDLDGAADDGAAGELDDVRDSVEYLAGGAGDDTIVASQTRYQSFDIAGNGGHDAITGGASFDRLDGGAGGDTLKGNDGSDTFVAGPGDDTEIGDAGADTFHEGVDPGPNGADDISGGDGVDQYSAGERTQPLTITVGDGRFNDGAAGEGDNVRLDVENVVAGQGNDTITGGPGRNHVSAGLGDDAVDGGAGDDEIHGRGGADTLRGGTGADRVFGEEGDDKLLEPPARDAGDLLHGGDDADAVSYEARLAKVSVSLNGVADDGDPGTASEGDDVRAEEVIGGGGHDLLMGSGSADTLRGQGGNDELRAEGGRDLLLGGAGNDLLHGGEGDDTLRGGANADRHLGAGGQDLTSYDDRTVGVRVSLDGIANDGVPTEGDHVDTEDVDGGSGPDRLTGNDQDSEFDGGPGDDTLDGGLGADVLDGGDGTDTASYAGRTAGLAVTLDGVARDGEETTRDELAEEGDNVLPTIENVAGGAGSDRLRGDGDANVLRGGDGSDTLDGAGGADVLDGELGPSDTADYTRRTAALAVGIDAVARDGEDADGDGIGEEGDRVTPTTERVEGGSGDDRLTGSAGANSLIGLGGDDVLVGGPGSGPDAADYLYGGDGVDTASYAWRSAADPVTVTLDNERNDGAPGEDDDVSTTTDIVVGGAGDDHLTGDDRGQTLAGGPGRDLLRGLEGDDRFDESAQPADPRADADEIAGGDGTDLVDYSGRTDPIAVSIDNLANDGVPDDGEAAGEGDNVLLDVENAVGSAQADVMVGDGDPNRFDGRGGGDSILGGAGDDSLNGGDGVDRVAGGANDDALQGGEGNDILIGDAGDDRFVEEPAWAGNDSFNGGDGWDRVDYGAREERVIADNDGVTGDDGRDANFDGVSEEKDRVGTTIDAIIGGRGPDVLTQARRPSELRCWGGLYGGPGADRLTGHGDGADFLHGGPDGDTLLGRGGDDHLEGGQGDDVEHGGDGMDSFIQARVFEDCDGWHYADTHGGDGADLLAGDDGVDSVRYRRGPETDLRVVLDGAAGDGAAGENDNVQADNVSGGEGDDVIIGDARRNVLGGAEGDDQVEGRGGDDELWDNRGTDWLYGGDGDDEFETDDGDDADHLVGGADTDFGVWDAGDARSTIP